MCAGSLFMRRAKAAGATVLPVDSEHNALFQAMSGSRRADVRRVILTASGGPFRTWSAADIRAATPEQALKHPNWTMGQKVTIDSATLMNKGLEVIEAHHLFALAPAEIDVLVHAQSIVHGLVEFQDFFRLFVPSVANFLVPALLMHFSVPRGAPAPRAETVRLKIGAKRIMALFAATIATASGCRGT